MNRALQIANAFPMNDADLKDAFCLASGQVIRDQLLNVARIERVQIEHAINGHLERVIHLASNYATITLNTIP